LVDPKAPDTSDSPPYVDVETVPLIYFDLAPAYGVMSGAIQVELASRTLSPAPNGPVEVKFITSGRLRCTPAAATHLRNALDAALKMLEQPHQSPSAASKLN
jgi:hypothetical protein